MGMLNDRKRPTYATLDPQLEGMDFRAIAERLTKEGHVLGHSTVRNILLRLLERFAIVFMATYGIRGDPAAVARDPLFQRGLADLIHEAIERGYTRRGGK